MKTYRLYAKFDTESKFLPMNWKNGTPVKNLIHASIFNEEDSVLVLKEAEVMNPDVKFELRMIK